MQCLLSALLVASVDTAPQRVVAYHVVATGRATWSRIDLRRVTTVVQFGPGWDADLAATAHAAVPRVEVLSEFGWACLPSQPCGWLSNRTAAGGKAAAAAVLAAARGADGVNVDIEGAGRPDCTAADLTAFVTALRAELDRRRPDMTLLVNVNAFPVAVSPRAGQAYNFTALAGPATGVAIMLYDMAWWNPGVPTVATPNSPLAGVAATLRSLVAPGSPQHVPASKLIAVFPWYGYDYLCNTTTPLSACANTLPYCCGPNTAAAQVSYAKATALLRLPSATAVHRDQPGLMSHTISAQAWGSQVVVSAAAAQPRAPDTDDGRLSPWFEYTDRAGERHQVHFDDTTSLPAKYGLVSALGLAGCGVWTANADYLEPLAQNHTAEQAALFSTLDSRSSP